MSENFVLVHGAWHGGWAWQPVASTLRAAPKASGDAHRVTATAAPVAACRQMPTSRQPGTLAMASRTV